MPASTQELTPTEQFWTATIRSHRDNMRDVRAGWDVLGRTYRGAYWQEDRAGGEERPEDLGDSGKGLTHEMNYLFGFTDTLVANVCPPHPQVTLKPRTRAMAEQTAHRGALSNEYMTRAKVGQHIRKATRLSCIYPRSILKVHWSSEKKRPVLRALKPHKVFFDVTADHWDDIRYVIEVKTLTRAMFESRLKRKGMRGSKGRPYRASAVDDVKYGQYPTWLIPQDKAGKGDEGNIVRNNYQWTVVYEVYDLVAKRYYHYTDGNTKALYEGPLPWTGVPNPFRLVTFHDNLEDLGGMSDGQLAYPAIARINEVSSLRLHHAKVSIPIGLLNAKLLDDPEAFQQSLNEATGPGDYAVFETQSQVRPEDIFSHTPVPSLNVDFDKILDQLVRDTEWVMAMPANQRGQASGTDVATDIAAMDGARKTRDGDRQEQVYDAVAWVSVSFLALFAQMIPKGFEFDTHLGGSDTTVTPQSLGFRDEHGDPIPFDVEDVISKAHPFNAESLNAVAQFRKLQMLLPVLTSSPDVDQRLLVQALLQMASLSEILASEADAAAKQAPPPPAGGMGPGAPSGDIQLPESDTAAAPMEGGQVDTGTGGPDQGSTGAAGLGMNV